MANKKHDLVKKKPLLYWRIGQHINGEIMKWGWGEKHLRHCLRVAETFPDARIVVSMIRQLSWTPIIALELGRTGIHVAEYLTESLPKEVMQEKFHKAIALARKRLENEGKERIAENVGKLLEGE